VIGARDPDGRLRLAGVAVMHAGDEDQGMVGAGQVELLVGAQFEAAESRPMQRRGFLSCKPQSHTPTHATTTSCCSTDSERPHRCCHLPNSVKIIDRRPHAGYSI